MTLFTYAQNLEDVILQRVFLDIENGFYVDVGANHPTNHSVTRAFYDRGWRGINVEPVNEWYLALQKERREDINLNIAAGQEAGLVTFYEVVGTGLSTLSKEYAEQARDQHNFTIVTRHVTRLTLTQVLEYYGAPEIHFLKIDTEGTEESVLKGLNLERFRPWVIVVEATKPMQQVENHEQWEGMLLEKKYSLVYRDGLNRFYLAAEHNDRQDRFRYPPNVFDQVVPYQLRDILDFVHSLYPSRESTSVQPSDAASYYSTITQSVGELEQNLRQESRTQLADALISNAVLECRLEDTERSVATRIETAIGRITAELKRTKRKFMALASKINIFRKDSMIRGKVRSLRRRYRDRKSSLVEPTIESSLTVNSLAQQNTNDTREVTTEKARAA